MLGPGREDLEAIGANMMDPGRAGAACSRPRCAPRAEALAPGRRGRRAVAGRPDAGLRPRHLALARLSCSPTGSLRAPLCGVRRTELLRAWADQSGPSDDDELELVALSEAARGSLRLLALDQVAPRMRVVLAADVPDDRVRLDEGSTLARRDRSPSRWTSR